MDIEAIYVALFTAVQVGSDWKTKSRRLKHWSEVAPSEQPALFQSQGNMHAKFTYRQPTIWTLDAELFVYANTGGMLIDVPGTIVNPLINQIITNLAPSELTGEQTLGGLVTSCRIEGDVITDEGTLGDQAVVILPIKILATK